MRADIQKCFELFSEWCDIATDWLLDYFSETDSIEKQINLLHYLKVDKRRSELARRLKELCRE